MNPSVWVPWRTKAVVDTNPLPFPAIRANDLADVVTSHLHSLTMNSSSPAQSLPVVPGWTYTNSYTLGEASPGLSAAAPNRRYYRRGSGNTTQWLKAVNTWSGAQLQEVAFYYSNDNQTTYVPLLDEDGNYVLKLSFFAGVAASCVIAGATVPNDGDTVVLNDNLAGKTYTFKTTLTPSEGQVHINGSLDAALLNLIRAINHTGTPNTDYKCAAALSFASAGPAVLSGHHVLITDKTAGTFANGGTLTVDGVRLTVWQVWSGGIDNTNDVSSTSWANTP